MLLSEKNKRFPKCTEKKNVVIMSGMWILHGYSVLQYIEPKPLHIMGKKSHQNNHFLLIGNARETDRKNTGVFLLIFPFQEGAMLFISLRARKHAWRELWSDWPENETRLFLSEVSKGNFDLENVPFSVRSSWRIRFPKWVNVMDFASTACGVGCQVPVKILRI